jgi:hypothetical protein
MGFALVVLCDGVLGIWGRSSSASTVRISLRHDAEYVTLAYRRGFPSALSVATIPPQNPNAPLRLHYAERRSVSARHRDGLLPMYMAGWWNGIGSHPGVRRHEQAAIRYASK